MTPASAAPLLANWYLLEMRVRLALHPDDPQLITTYLSAGDRLVAGHGHDAWRVRERALVLLLDTAHDALLPIAWRMACLDSCCRPLGQLGPLVDSDARASRLRTLAWRLARFSLQPAQPHT